MAATLHHKTHLATQKPGYHLPPTRLEPVWHNTTVRRQILHQRIQMPKRYKTRIETAARHRLGQTSEPSVQWPRLSSDKLVHMGVPASQRHQHGVGIPLCQWNGLRHRQTDYTWYWAEYYKNTCISSVLILPWQCQEKLIAGSSSEGSVFNIPCQA